MTQQQLRELLYSFRYISKIYNEPRGLMEHHVEGLILHLLPTILAHIQAAYEKGRGDEVDGVED